MFSPLTKSAAIASVAATGIALSDRDRRDAIESVASGAARFGRAFGYATLVSFDFKYSLRNLEKGSDDYEAATKKVNQRAAERLLYVCSKHGGVYTKFGQHVSSMNHVLPKEYTETLKVLQDRNPSVGVEEVARTVRGELGAEICELFREFDQEAIAAASLAQVHRAVTVCGKEVAVKLQYPGLEAQVSKDLIGMRFLAGLVGKIFPEYQYTWLFPDFEETIGLELDFIQEGTNAERVARMFRHRDDVFVPAIHWKYSSRRVLTMDYVHGVKISDRTGIEERGMDSAAVAKTVTHTFGDMMFCHGFVHCDPHPGNLMVRPDPACVSKAAGGGKVKGKGFGIFMTRERSVPHQVALLDHGMYRRLDSGFRLTYSALWKALISKDDVLGKQCTAELGVDPEMYDALSLILTWRPATSTARVGQRITEEERLALKAKYKAILTPDNLNAFLERLPRDMLFVMRTSDLVRSLNKVHERDQDLGGTTRQRLIALAESAVRGLHIPNPEDAFSDSPASSMSPHEEYVGASNALAEEEAFREFLDREGVCHPARLALASPRAGVNRLVSSERGMVAPQGLYWWEWLSLRVRMWAVDTAFRFVWWWHQRKPFTDRDIG